MTKTCPHCNVVVKLEDGHTSWKCPNCGGFIVDVYGSPQVKKKAMKKYQEKNEV